MKDIEDKKECEGSCVENFGEHKGKVVKVTIYGQGWDDLEFYYCNNAIEEDKKRGFTVIINDNK